MDIRISQNMRHRKELEKPGAKIRKKKKKLLGQCRKWYGNAL